MRMTKPTDKDTTPLNNPHILSGPFWGELRVFLAVAKAKSYNRASEQLNMSQPTVSRQVRRLQDIMGTQLVLPTQSGIKLTRQGEDLARSLLELDQKLFDISSDLNADARAAEGVVHLSVGEGMAGLFLTPTIVAFTEQYPKIKLRMHKPVSVMDFRENATDVLLGGAPSTQPEVTSRPLGFIHYLPVATRAYIERYGVPTRANLSSHCFVHCDFHTEGGIWETWHATMARGVIAHTSDSAYVHAMMTKVGLGIGLMGSYVLAESMYIPLELGVHMRFPMYALALTERLNAKPVRLVFDWMSDVFGAANPWFSPELKLDSLPQDSLSGTMAQLLAVPERNP
jgi:DNA-binding transcriptional LysR family regulator